MIKPTILEIETYCRGRSNGIDAEAFFHFYESKGWKVGKCPMVSWHSAIVTWEKKQATTNKPAIQYNQQQNNVPVEMSASELAYYKRKIVELNLKNNNKFRKWVQK